MVEPVFPEAVIGPLVYVFIGFLVSIIAFLVVYIYLNRSSKSLNPDVRQLNMSKSRILVLEAVLDGGVLQSDLPGETGLSKATVSQSISDLKDKNLVLRKKRGNTYLIECRKDVLEEMVDYTSED